MELAQKYQVGDFWNNIFDQEKAKQFMEEFAAESNDNQNQGKPSNQDIHYPSVDIFTVDSQIVILIDIPGVDKRDVQLTVSGTKLTIRGISRLPFKPDMTVKSERVHGEFGRTIDLPEPTETALIKARYNHGLLVVTYPKKYEEEEQIIID